MKRFFAYSECGFTFHATAEKAKAEAERLLAVERDFASREGEWSDDALCIMWGEMRGRAEQHWMQTESGEGYLEMTIDKPKQ